ncbi:carbon-nitrogen hydrolase family protein [Roseovarius rhodophyticola]|uniref:Carbon-nitrogen hydrolase family protein n=1 Tax=Roseovarius rhodophyticola TaxID=3080827 RepID=A0ABZ2THI1_9RHOB|nr:carbon-nitrogen hydrolase family protein [Roseovarius sp. W115]MDV2929485.1 carbon-nitrogen hydrolase family protein [Roseovarius sp. W115]
MPRPLDIACLQTRPMPDFQSALDEAMPLAEAAVKAGADMLFLPEYCGGLKTEGAAVAPPSAPEASHPFLQAMQALARDRRVWINLGSIAVDGPDGRIINRGIMLDDAGHIRGRYDKINMFDIQLSETEVYRESAHVEAGCEAVIHDTPFARIGHTICYDLRFPDLWRSLAQAGAEILICPAAFTKKTGEAHWHVLNRARAIENTRFVISPCAIGPVPGGGESYGHSLVINPWGEVIADGGTIPGVVQAQIDLDQVVETEARIPSLANEQEFTLVSVDAKRSVA